MVHLWRHASLDSSLFIRKMLVAARAHTSTAKRCLNYFTLNLQWMVLAADEQQVKDLLKPGGKSSGKGK